MNQSEERFTNEEWESALENLKFIANVSDENPSHEVQHISLLRRLDIIDEFIEKTKRRVLDGLELSFTPEERLTYTWSGSDSLRPEIYQLVGRVFLGKFAYALLDSTADIVSLPLRDKEGKEMLITLLDVWDKYMRMSSHFAEYFKQLYHGQISMVIELDEKPALHVICHAMFDQYWAKVQNTIVFMMKQQHHRDSVINDDLVKRIIEFSLEIQTKGIRQYYNSLEEAILAETADFFFTLQSDWVASARTFGGYLKEAEFWLAKEKIKREAYLNEDLMAKVLESARFEIIDKPATRIAWLIPANGLGLVMLMPRAEN